MKYIKSEAYLEAFYNDRPQLLDRRFGFQTICNDQSVAALIPAYDQITV